MLQWQISPETPVAWCPRLTVYPTLHVCAGVWVGGVRGEGGSSAVPQGPRLTDAPGPGHHPVCRQGCTAWRTGHGHLTVSAWELPRSLLLRSHWPEGHRTLHDFRWGGWSAVSRVPSKDRRRHGAAAPHTSQLPSPILEMILSKSDKFTKMLDQRISSYPWPWPKKIGNHPSIRGKTHIDIKNDEIYLLSDI